MMICVKCGAVSPAKSTYCCGCGRGFGGRVCPSGHVSPPGAKFCSTCGRPGKELSEPTGFLDVAPVARAVAWALIAAAAVWGCRHPSETAAFLAATFLWGLAHVFGVAPCAILRIAYQVALFFILADAFTYMLPERIGIPLRRFLNAGVIHWPGIIWRATGAIWRMLARLVEGRPDPGNKGR